MRRYLPTTVHSSAVERGLISFEHLSESAFERFCAQGDRGERDCYLVGHAGGQKEPTLAVVRSARLLGAFLHLRVEVVADVWIARSCR